MQSEEFRKLGFRCIEPTQVQVDGSVLIVAAFGYMRSLEKQYPACTEHEKRAWKFYSVVPKNQKEGIVISELVLEKQLGETFEQLK